MASSHPVRKLVIGERLSTNSMAHQRLDWRLGLALFAADALSSATYATEEILRAMLAEHLDLSSISIPISFAITILIVIVAICYWQVIFAYPKGGGAYNVASDNLGKWPSLVAAAALLIDYVLTVAVSVSAGVAAITSVFPDLIPWSIWIALFIITSTTILNLRGMKESGRIVAMLVYPFIVLTIAMIGYGVLLKWMNALPSAGAPMFIGPQMNGFLTVWAVMHVFAAGCTAATGIEAVSNGVPTFEEPSSRNAAKTNTVMALLLGVLFVGITVLAYWTKAFPSDHETIVSQVARTIFGNGPLYLIIQTATVMILLLAANTPFAGFPQVASALAQDGYAPRQFLNRGTRLVFSNGIIALALAAAGLVIMFGADTHALIPLYAVGVFLCFSLSQAGMIRKGGCSFSLHTIANVLGFIITMGVFWIVFLSKFSHGAWLLAIAVPLLIVLMNSVHLHYQATRRALAIKPEHALLVPYRDRVVILLVAEVNELSRSAIMLINAFSPAMFCGLHIYIGQEEREAVEAQWHQYFPDTQLVTICAEDRDISGALVDYLIKATEKHRDDPVLVVIPELAVPGIFHAFLHNQNGFWMRRIIEQHPEIHAEVLNTMFKLMD